MDEWAERVLFIESIGLNVTCGNFPPRLIGRGNYSGSVTLAAASPAHFAYPQPQPLPPSSEIILCLQRVGLGQRMGFALLFCWLDLVAALIGVWAPRPVATFQWFSSHIQRSAPAASDRTPLVFFPSPPLDSIFSISHCWPGVGIVYILLLYQKPNCSVQCRWPSTDGRLRHKSLLFQGFNADAIVLVNNMQNRNMNHQKILTLTVAVWV